MKPSQVQGMFRWLEPQLKEQSMLLEELSQELELAKATNDDF